MRSMAEFRTFYNLCPVDNPKEFIGLSKDRKDGNLIITLGCNIVLIMQLSPQKLIVSWSMSEKLSGKVVYDSQTDQYVGVFARNYIRFWNIDESNITGKKKFKFHKSILDLVPHNDDEILVVYTDGTCEYLSSALKFREENHKQIVNDIVPPPQIWDPKVCSLSNDQKVLTYFKKSANIGFTVLTVKYLERNGKQKYFNEFELDRHDPNLSLVGQTVVEGEKPHLLTFWSDQRIFSMPLQKDNTEKDSPGNLSAIINLLNTENPISIMGISNNYMVAYGSNSTQEGASLLLYNMQFRLVKAKQFFKVHFNYSRLWLIGNNILLLMGHNLCVIPFYVSKELLSDVIGVQILNVVEDVDVGGESVKEDTELEETLILEQMKCKKFPVQSHEKSDKSKQCTISTPELPYDLLNTSFEKMAQETTVNMSLRKSNAGIQIDGIFDQNPIQFHNHKIQNLVRILEENGASTQEITEKVLTVALKSELFLDIIVCIQRYANVSSKMISKVLKSCFRDLRLDDFAIQDRSELLKTNVQANLKIALVNEILKSRADAGSIVSSLQRGLNVTAVQILIENLYYNMSTEQPVNEMYYDSFSNIDQQIHTSYWLCTILKSCFQMLCLSQNQHFNDILRKLRHTMRLYQVDASELRTVYALVSKIVSKKKIKRNVKYCKWYSIEEIKIY